jgi:hypothetical protein
MKVCLKAEKWERKLGASLADWLEIRRAGLKALLWADLKAV